MGSDDLMTIPAAIEVGDVHFTAGIKISTVQAAINRLHERMRQMEARQWPQPTDPETQRALAAAVKLLAGDVAKLRSERDLAVKALRNLVYQGTDKCWRTSQHGDSDVTGLVHAALTGGHHAG